MRDEQWVLLDLAIETWRRRGAAKLFGLPYKEETITEQFLLDLALRRPADVTIVTFHRNAEALVGADWLWCFEDIAQGKSFSVLVQAKRLDDFEVGYPEIWHRSGTSSPPHFQAQRLIAQAEAWNVPPLYVFYNHLNDIGRIPQRCCSIAAHPELVAQTWGISVASAHKVWAAYNSRHFDTHRQHSIPLHCLLCPGGGNAGPDRVASAVAALSTSDDTATHKAEMPEEPQDSLGRRLPPPVEVMRRLVADNKGSFNFPEFATEFPGVGGIIFMRDREPMDEPRR